MRFGTLVNEAKTRSMSPRSSRSNASRLSSARSRILIPGAFVESRLSRRGATSVPAGSPVAMRMLARACAGSNVVRASRTRLALAKISAIGACNAIARVVGLMGFPGIRTNSSSPNVARKRASAALMPGCPRPMRWPARVTLRSAINASKATRRFKSVEARFKGRTPSLKLICKILKIDFPNVMPVTSYRACLSAYGDRRAAPMTVNRNRQWILSIRPAGQLTGDEFSWNEAPIPEPADGQVLIRILWLSLDPAQRIWMSRDSYKPAIPLGTVMQSFAAGQVLESRHPDFKAGDLVRGDFGWQDYVVADGTTFGGIHKILPGVSP